MNIFDGLKPPKVIFEIDSELNGHIKVIEVGKTRKIVIGDIIQSLSPNSPACSKLVWGRLTDSLKKRVPDAKKVLILGLGGGTMAHLVSSKLPGVEIVGVEWDKIMVDIAKKYFYIDSIPNLRVISDNALKVVVEPEEFGLVPGSFDALIVDIFNGDRYPDLGKTGNFISAVKKLITRDGLLIFNRIYTESYQEDVNIFMNGLDNFFEEVDSEIVAGYTNSDNIIIFGKS